MVADPPGPVRIVERPEPLPLPGQLMRVDDDPKSPEAAEPTERITNANAAARIEPVRDGFINAVQLYWASTTAVSLRASEALSSSGRASSTRMDVPSCSNASSGPIRQVSLLFRREQALKDTLRNYSGNNANRHADEQ